MQVVVHEWSCSGGLRGPAAAAVVGSAADRRVLETIVTEGRQMLAALVADAARARDLQLTVLIDEALVGSFRVQAGTPTRVVSVPPDGEEECLVRAARSADWVVTIAPETAGILAARVGWLRATGARVAAPPPPFVAVAADKQATVAALAAAGVPVPAGRVLAAGEPWPAGFARPAVVKALDGCGGDGVLRIHHPADLPPSPRPRRLEALASGMPVGVSCLCGPAGVVALPPVRQRFSSGPSPRFLGGEHPLDAPLARRAAALGVRAIVAVGRATAPAVGWVGVDMILGTRDDGGGDRVLEVNPRLTTSFVGLAPSGDRSLLETLLSHAAGEAISWRAAGGSFSTVGAASESCDAAIPS